MRALEILLDLIDMHDPSNDWGGRECNKFVPVLGRGRHENIPNRGQI